MEEMDDAMTIAVNRREKIQAFGDDVDEKRDQTCN
jgi:hypothetical protein